MSKAGMAGTSPPSVAGVASDASAGAYEHYPPRNDAHAVVIGINQYNDPGIPQLQFARADAEAMHSVLVDPAVGRFRPENVVLLVDENATERRIRSEIGTRLPRRAGPDDAVFVYFAGHGAPVIDQK